MHPTMVLMAVGFICLHLCVCVLVRLFQSDLDTVHVGIDNVAIVVNYLYVCVCVCVCVRAGVSFFR